MPLDETERKRIEGAEPPPPPAVHKPKSKSASTAPPQKSGSLIIVLLAFLGCLVLAVAGLIVLNRFFPDWPRRHEEPVPTEAAVVKPVRPSQPPPSSPARQETSPVAAVKLMLAASLSGDRRTAYAQWAIGPDDTVTVERGTPVTLAEQTDAAASLGSRVNPQQYEYRLLSQSGTEAKVGQYRDGAPTQVYSLRRQGAYWKLYNAAPP